MTIGLQSGDALTFVKALNESWTRADGAALAEFFHPDMVAVTATDRDILRGRTNCMASWQGFSKSATIHRWKEIDPEVRLFDDTAIVTYYFDISFDSGGQTINLGGRDMFVLKRQDGRWWAVADHFSAFPGGGA